MVDEVKVDDLVRDMVDSNEWLSGWVDLVEGDPSSLLESSRYYRVMECGNVGELYRCLREYDGTFRFGDLVLIKSWHYGAFVYALKNPRAYIEHLDIDGMSFEDFVGVLRRLLGSDVELGVDMADLRRKKVRRKKR